MDEYRREINELQAQVEAMIEAEEDKREIAELQMQVQVLRTIYQQAVTLFEEGRRDERLPQHLALRGYGDWTLDNVYSFVYDTSVDLPAEGHHSFVGEIRSTDFAELLR
jgi:hypothetical protein